ncbi:hypothetical protein ACNQFZ_13605 [Schinkia sp. CFF1]
MISLEPQSHVVNQKILQGRDRQHIRSNFIFYVPYPLFLDPDDQFSIHMPLNPEKKHILQVLSRRAYTLNHNHEFFGFDNVDEKDKLKPVHLRNDRFGITGYSKVLISYDRYLDMFDSEAEVDGVKMNKAVELMCEVYNYFLDIYAAVVGHRQAMKISPHDIHTLHFSNLDQQGNQFNEIRFFTLLGATLYEGFVSPPKDVRDRLQKVLASADPKLAQSGLGVNAVRLLYGGDYLNGIVQAVTQLESYLYMVFEKKFEEKNINEIGRIMNTLGLSNLVELLGLVLSESDMTEIKQKLDTDKVIKAISIRNKYIHEGTNKENIHNLLIAEDYINQINTLCIELAKQVGIDHPLNWEKSGWSKS